MNVRIKGSKATALAALLTACTLSACVTTEQQADGSTRVRVSVADALGTKQAAPQPAPQSVQPSRSVASQGKALKTPAPAAAPSPAAGAKLSDEMRARIVDHLECKGTKPYPGKTNKARENANNKYNQAMHALDANGSITIDPPLMVYGLPVTKILYSGDSWELLYRAYFPGVKKETLIKAAGLKLGKDKIEYGMYRKKSGLLTLGEDEGVWALTCSFDTGSGL